MNFITMKLRLSFAALVTASLLMSCGGGDNVSSTTTASYPSVDYFTDGGTYPPYAQPFPTGYWNPLSEAHEIVDLGQMYAAPQSITAIIPTYFGSGTNPVPDNLWFGSYAPPSPYSKNSTRNLQFNAQYFIGSPGVPIGTTSFITTSDGYTWAGMSTTHNAMTPFQASDYTGSTPPVLNAFSAGNWILTPVAGVVKLTINYKAQNMQFYARQNNDPTQAQITRYFVKDAYDNLYLMHASGSSDPAQALANFNAATLPPGWKRFATVLPQNLVITPSTGSNNLMEYTLLRDDKDSTYHQVYWSTKGLPAQDVTGPMEIWGGNTSDTLFGAPGHDIYAGAGNDTIRVGSGSHYIDGGTGVDTCLYEGSPADYTIVQLANGQYSITGKTGVDTLNSIEILQFVSGAQIRIGNSEADAYVESTATIWLKQLLQTAAWY
jgi:hypothetical protein